MAAGSLSRFFLVWKVLISLTAGSLLWLRNRLYKRIRCRQTIEETGRYEFFGISVRSFAWRLSSRLLV
jgi:hypothetical protein